MKVILTEDVPFLGEAGQTVDVARGYARNYLFPRKLALEATSRNLKELGHRKRHLLTKIERSRRDAETLAEKIGTVSISFSRAAGESEKLFGSVTSMDIQEALSNLGIEIERKKIVLPEPIKQLGDFAVPIKLQSSVMAEVRISVTKAE
ncbi:MAG: 50S ribosomal protein L9 [Deltaproteobacteria bacterium]|nr:50S ribosomal protein L9 [Deltaproteobacteria bacterium]MBW2308045.1 50S ribosomal protein L9 [Deltaproteobacteria bacterium]